MRRSLIFPSIATAKRNKIKTTKRTGALKQPSVIKFVIVIDLLFDVVVVLQLGRIR